MEAQKEYAGGAMSAEDARLEVLDPASLPTSPVWPPRGAIIGGVSLMGALLGAIVGLCRLAWQAQVSGPVLGCDGER